MDPSDPYKLQRFIDAQDGVIEQALAELRGGSKQSHWMWFVFPQLAGLGRSPTAEFFGLASFEEARTYLAHPVLGSRLRQAVEILLRWADGRSAEQILGPVDSMKLRSSLTLFDRIEPKASFERALLAFFEGKPDELTLALLGGQR
ncbi:MAG TPA: DUF1810 domain-containing protein [Sphingomicrobium sp.]|nr:DUF1810 domain-containing protein [Sphingomicrobium sp.]